MAIHFGNRLYGKVDQVPGLFYVATEFFHLQFIPLIPVRSRLIVHGAEKEHGLSGVVIKLSGKSVLFAWLRAVLWMTASLSTFCAFFALWARLDGHWDWLIVLGLGAVATALFWALRASYRFSHARPIRALQLARLGDIAPEVVAEHFVSYPNIDKLLEELIHEKETLHR